MNKLRLIKDFYGKYNGVIRFNKNIIVAAIVTAVLDVIIVSSASLVYHANYLLISLISLIADFAIYNFIFIVLFFLDNKKRYQNPDGTKNKQKIKLDSIKLVTTLGLSEIAYLSTKFISTYLVFVYTRIDPSQISLTTTVLAWVLYLLTANIMIKKTEFFK